MNRGFLFALAAYLAWGFLPAYWRELHDLPALEILAHRIVWSLLLIGGVLTYRRQWGWLGEIGQDGKKALLIGGAAGLLGINWFVYIWAVNNGFVLEASLGYFITPLVNVVLGIVLLKEQLRVWQVVAVSLGTLAVFYMAVSYGSLPWVGISLALTFGGYGFAKKMSQVTATESMFAEMAALAIPALVYLLWQESTGQAALGHGSWVINGLLLGAGVVTALPLIWFGAAARLIPLTSLAFFQYLAPSITFLLGVFLYKEAFSGARILGFSLIWVALAIYTTDSLLARRRRHQARVAARAL